MRPAERGDASRANVLCLTAILHFYFTIAIECRRVCRYKKLLRTKIRRKNNKFENIFKICINTIV